MQTMNIKNLIPVIALSLTLQANAQIVGIFVSNGRVRNLWFEKQK